MGRGRRGLGAGAGPENGRRRGGTGEWAQEMRAGLGGEARKETGELSAGAGSRDGGWVDEAEQANVGVRQKDTRQKNRFGD